MCIRDSFTTPILLNECFAEEITAGIPAAIFLGLDSLRELVSMGVVPLLVITFPHTSSR